MVKPAENPPKNRIEALTNHGRKINMGVQVAAVTKTLFSVRRTREAGNIVVFVRVR